MAHVFGILAATAFIMLCTLLPFFPGPYDSLALPLSAMAQIFGYVGLLLVPAGALWAASGHSRTLAEKSRAIAMVALIASTIVGLAVSLGALAFGGATLGLGALVLGVYALVRVIRLLNASNSNRGAPVSAVARYLLIVPVAVTCLQAALLGRAIDFSRSRAIRNSEPLIAAIERYRSAHGRYPPSLLAATPDYSPGVVGVRAFMYEPSGETYNLAFEQLTTPLATREFVVYNPRDEQVMTSHALDLLEFTGADLERRRGYYAVRDIPHWHWKVFWFD